MDRVSLRDYVDMRLAALEAQGKEAQRQSERSVEHALGELHYRLEAMNEFRTQILTERNQFALKVELERLDQEARDHVRTEPYETAHAELVRRVEELDDRQRTTETITEQSRRLIAYAFSAATLGLAIITVIVQLLLD